MNRIPGPVVLLGAVLGSLVLAWGISWAMPGEHTGGSVLIVAFVLWSLALGVWGEER